MCVFFPPLSLSLSLFRFSWESVGLEGLCFLFLISCVCWCVFGSFFNHLFCVFSFLPRSRSFVWFHRVVSVWVRCLPRVLAVWWDPLLWGSNTRAADGHLQFPCSAEQELDMRGSERTTDPPQKKTANKDIPARRSPLRLAKFLEQAFGPASFYGCSIHTPWFRANAVPDTNVQAGLPRLVDDRVREQTRNCDLRWPKPYDQNCFPAHDAEQAVRGTHPNKQSRVYTRTATPH